MGESVSACESGAHGTAVGHVAAAVTTAATPCHSRCPDQRPRSASCATVQLLLKCVRLEPPLPLMCNSIHPRHSGPPAALRAPAPPRGARFKRSMHCAPLCNDIWKPMWARERTHLKRRALEAVNGVDLHAALVQQPLGHTVAPLSCCQVAASGATVRRKAGGRLGKRLSGRLGERLDGWKNAVAVQEEAWRDRRLLAACLDNYICSWNEGRVHGIVQCSNAPICCRAVLHTKGWCQGAVYQRHTTLTGVCACRSRSSWGPLAVGGGECRGGANRRVHGAPCVMARVMGLKHESNEFVHAQV